jgi:hypothetical protein
MRQAAFSYSVVFVALAACGGDSKSNNPDGSPPPESDATIDAPAGGGGTPIVITGAAVQIMANGSVAPVAGAIVAGYRNGDDTTAVATTTTDAQGMYMLMVPSAGGPLDGYLKSTKSGLKDTYLYAPAPIEANTTAPVNMIDQDTLTILSGFASVTQGAANGLIALIVVDGPASTSMPVAGAAVSVTPSGSDTAYRYNRKIGTLEAPSASATTTDTDGTAYIFNVPPNTTVTVGAMKTGTIFKSHGLKAVPGALTTTLITP